MKAVGSLAAGSGGFGFNRGGAAYFTLLALPHLMDNGAEAVNRSIAAMACVLIQGFPERLCSRSRGKAMATYFGNYNNPGSKACGLLLFCLIAGACSSSKHAGQALVIDDFERSALNAMALRLPAPAMTSLQQALRNYQ